MTKAEVIAAVKPTLQNKASVSGLVNFDLASYTDFNVSISANITINLQNVTVPNYVIICVTHTIAGTTITNLPGGLTYDFSWASGTGDQTIVAGRYDGTRWTWQSTIYTVPVTTTTTTTSTTTTTTTSSTTTTTTTAGFSGFVSWFSLGSGLEQYNTSKGVRTQTGQTGGWGATHAAWSNEALGVGQVLTLKCGVIAGGHGIFGINATRIADYSGTASTSFPKVGFQLVTGLLYYTDTISSNVSTGYSPATNDLIRLSYIGSTIVAEYSTNAGSSWNAIHTFSTAIFGTFFFGIQIYGNISLEGFDEISIA